jgi:hypothetical protein
MAKDAQSYISSFTWCYAVLGSYFAGGFGGIFAIFLFHIRPSRSEVDPWIWVMLGDVPRAYLPRTDCTSPSEAFGLYFSGMSDCPHNDKDKHDTWSSPQAVLSMFNNSFSIKSISYTSKQIAALLKYAANSGSRANSGSVWDGHPQ